MCAKRQRIKRDSDADYEYDDEIDEQSLTSDEPEEEEDSEDESKDAKESTEPELKQEDFAVNEESGKRFRNWFLTLNNYTQDEVDSWYHEAKKTSYTCICKEVGEKEKTPHLHGIFVYTGAKTFTTIKKTFPRANIQRVYMLPNSIKYIQKGGNFKEFGKKPKSQQEKGKMEQDLWDGVLELAKEGNFEDVPSRIQVHQIRNLEFIHQRAIKKKADLTETNEAMEWHYGVPGSGKSTDACDRYPDAYLKPIGKWWDDYMNEDVVIIEDMDPKKCCDLACEFKRWTDRRAFTAEIKGAMRKIRPRKIIVTSNYHINQCFSGVDLTAMLRRFDIYKYVAKGERYHEHKREVQEKVVFTDNLFKRN